MLWFKHGRYGSQCSEDNLVHKDNTGWNIDLHERVLLTKLCIEQNILWLISM